LAIVAGQIAPDTGTIVRTLGKRLSYLAQSGIAFRQESIRECADAAFNEFHELEARSKQLAESLTEQSSSKTERILAEIHEINEVLLDSGFYQRSARIEQTLTGLGFKARQFDDQVDSLSGGWQMRLALARILLYRPDIMLLDEPTNYLDLETREWLLQWLADYPGAMVIVSHDRYILDSAINQVAELYQGRLRLYKGSYANYEATRTLELEQVLAAWKKQQDEIAHLERFVERFKAKASKASQAQSRVKQLEKMELIEIPDGIRSVHFSFPIAPASGETVVTLEQVSKFYDERCILDDLDLTIARGEKVALLGTNGAGKSTLLKLIAQESSTNIGKIHLGHSVKMAYFAQEADSTLNQELSVLEEVESVAPTDMLPQVRTMLGAFLFHNDDVFKPISVLSGGERSRVALVKMLLEPANLLVLDEPTNHLDLTSKAILLDALKAFQGTVVFVSHDRYFIRDLATRIISLEPIDGKPSRVINYPGDFEYYQWRKSQQHEATENNSASVKIEAKSSLPTQNQQIRIDSKKIKADMKRIEREEEQLLLLISQKESSIAQIEQDLADPAVYTNGEKTKNLCGNRDTLEQELQLAHERWEVIAEQLEELRTQAQSYN
jgi:ATP-binding cassette subfamily F protein 3